MTVAQHEQLIDCPIKKIPPPPPLFCLITGKERGGRGKKPLRQRAQELNIEEAKQQLFAEKRGREKRGSQLRGEKGRREKAEEKKETQGLPQAGSHILKFI